MFSARRGRYKVALLRGHPSALIWHDENRKPGCLLLIALDASFSLADCPPSLHDEHLIPSGSALTGLAGAAKVTNWIR